MNPLLKKSIKGIAAGGAFASEFPLYGILRMFLGNGYEKYAVPENEPGNAVKARLLHSDENPAPSLFEKLGIIAPTYRHYQFIGDNGWNIGLGRNGEFTDPASVLPEYTLSNPFDGVHYDAKIVEKGIKERKKAIEAIRDLKRESPDLYGDTDDPDLGTYHSILNNCHDYIADILWRGAGNSGR